MGGISETEFDTSKYLLGLDLKNEDVRALLRLYNLIPTKEQHLTLLKLKELDIPYTCVDQNPLALYLRWWTIDKASSAHLLLDDRDKKLAQRIKSFINALDNRNSFLQTSKPYLCTDILIPKIQEVKRLGLN